MGVDPNKEAAVTIPKRPPTRRRWARWLATPAAVLLLIAATRDVGIPPRPGPPPGAAAPFDHLVGEWSGAGGLLGRPARFEMRWSVGAAPGVYRLYFSNGFVDQGAGPDAEIQPVLTADALYRQAPDGSVSGTWFDTRGVRIELVGTTSPTELRIAWTAPTENGVTLYRIDGEGGGVEVVDSVQAGDGWREFGRAHYTRR